MIKPVSQHKVQKTTARRWNNVTKKERKPAGRSDFNIRSLLFCDFLLSKFFTFYMQKNCIKSSARRLISTSWKHHSGSTS